MNHRCSRGYVERSLPGRLLRRLHPAAELGQAAFAMVTGIAILLVLTAGILVSTTTQHDPLVQEDVLQHLAYRGLEAGIDSYLTTIDNNPNLINCNDSNTTGPAPAFVSTTNGSPGCTSTLLPALDTWTQVPSTSGDGSSVPEFYMWTNPQFCFSTVVGINGSPACTAPSTTAGATLAYIKEQVWGAAEIGNRYAYQSAQAEFTPENGFLSNIWWSNYEATDPQTSSNPNTAHADCTYDWNNSYYGPDINNKNGSVPFPNSPYCNAVFFGPQDVLYGPVYSNDSIYVDQFPKFGVPAGSGQPAVPSTVTTHDPHCLFVDPNKGEWSASGSTSCANASSQVGEYNSTTSTDNAPFEPIPTSDSELGTIAAQGGCEYSGPTTIELYYNTAKSQPYMTVTSPDTPTSGSSDLNNASTNSNNCGVGTNAGIGVPVPSGTQGNDVIFVQNTPSSQQPCVSGANPFDDSANSGANSQIGYYYDVSGTSADCEADVFVSNAPAASGTVPGVSGNLTIASQNNIIVDGNITYTKADCGSSFNSTYTGQCAYNSGTTPNDTLGLIAYHFVEVDHPVQQPDCGWSGCSQDVEPACGTSGAPSPPLCDPNTGSGLVIDAAILALNDSFTVNNYTIGSPEGQLTVYGTIAQDWRGAIGTFSSSSGTVVSGYNKYYLWDSRLEYVTVPYYLNPGTPSWALTSTGVLQGSSDPCSGSATLPYPWPQTSGTTPSCNLSQPPSLPV